MKLKEEEIAGVNVEIEVNNNGQFTIKNASGDKLGSNYELDKAITSARAMIAKSKIKVSVAFRTAAGEYGIATGIHAGTKNVLARIGDQSMQMDYGPLKSVLKANTPQYKLDRLGMIVTQMRDLETERLQIEREYKFDLKHAVEVAIEEASS